MVLDLLNWTKVSGTNFFWLASLANYLYYHFLNLWHQPWSKSNCLV